MIRNVHEKIKDIDFSNHKLIAIQDYYALFDVELNKHYSCLAEQHARAESANGRFYFNETAPSHVLTDPAWLAVTIDDLFSSSQLKSGDYASLSDILGPNVPIWDRDELEKNDLNVKITLNPNSYQT